MFDEDISRRLAQGRNPVTAEMWNQFWERLGGGDVARAEAVNLLSLLSASIPDGRTLDGFITSLRARRSPGPCPTVPGVVNVVGIGGGPATFNISTAAAFVAAAMGVRVVKTGSRGHSSDCGSIDLLQHLRVPLAGSHEETDAMLERFGIAFAGHYVYPRELALLARVVLPLPMKAFGRFLNAVGPFLADVPAAAQLTGVSDWALLPKLKPLVVRIANRRIWLSTNAIGADELISFVDNVVFCSGSSETFCIIPESLRFGPGRLTDLAAAASRDGIVAHFQAILSGSGPRGAIETICLNAAALGILSGIAITWPEAVQRARVAIELGQALRLAEAVRRWREGDKSPALASGIAHD